MTRGAGAAVLGAGLCLAAELFAVHALLIPGLALLFLSAGATAVVRLLARRVSLLRDPPSAAAEEGMRLHVTTKIVGPRALRRSGEFAAVEGGPRKPRRWLDGDELHVAATARRRGVHEVAPSVMRFSDPFGLSERTVRSRPTELLVLPRVERVGRSDLSRLAATTPTPRAPVTSSGELDGLQPADEYATAARIHWPSFARTGTLMERRLRAEVDSRPLVVLDGRGAAGDDAFDMAVRATASLAVALARAGGCSLLLPPERRAHRLDPPLASWQRIHARLALLEPSEAIAWDVIARARLLLWVSASTEVRAMNPTRAASACYLVSPFPSGERSVLFAVAGCSVQPMPARVRVGGS